MAGGYGVTLVDSEGEEKEENYLCIGDHICLYCMDSSGYVFSDRTSSCQNRLFTFHNQDREDPQNIPYPQGKYNP